MTATAEKTATKTPPTKLTLPLVRLQKALATIAPAVERKTTIPVLSSVRVEQGEDTLEFVSTNLDLTIRARVVSAGAKPARPFLLPALKTESYAKLLDGEDVSLSCTENRATLRCGRAVTQLPLQSVANFPTTPDAPGESAIAMSQDVLARMIEFVSIAISQEEGRYILHGALLELDGKAISLVATDGHRLSRYSKACTDSASTTLLPAAFLTAVKKTMANGDESIRLEVGKESVFATLADRTGTVLIAHRKLTGQFPNYRAVLPTKFAACVKVDADAAAAAVRRCLAFADSGSGAVKLTVGPEEIRLRGASAEAGETDESIDVVRTSDDFEPFEIGFNGHYLYDAFSRLSGETQFCFSALNAIGSAMIVAEPVEGEQFEYVVMPLKVS